MKKIIILLFFINFSIHAQKHHELLHNKKLNSLIEKGNENSYEGFLALGFHYYRVFKTSKKVELRNEGLVRSKDYLKKAIDKYQSNGNHKDNNYLKALHYYGLLNLELKNISIGNKYISMASQKEFLPSMYCMAHFLEKGIGFEKDINKAMLLYKKIAFSPDNELKGKVFDRIGRIYHYEFNDNDRALLWLSKALDIGFSESTYLFLKIREDYNIDYVIKTEFIPCSKNQPDTKAFLILDEKKSLQDITEFFKSKLTQNPDFKKTAKTLNDSYLGRNQKNVRAVIRISFDNKGLYNDISILYKQGNDFARINLKEIFRTDEQYNEKTEFRQSIYNMITNEKIYIKPPIKKCEYQEFYVEFDYLLSGV